MRTIGEICAPDSCSTSLRDVLYTGTSCGLISVKNIYMNRKRTAEWTLLPVVWSSIPNDLYAGWD